MSDPSQLPLKMIDSKEKNCAMNRVGTPPPPVQHNKLLKARDLLSPSSDSRRIIGLTFLSVLPALLFWLRDHRLGSHAPRRTGASAFCSASLLSRFVAALGCNSSTVIWAIQLKIGSGNPLKTSSTMDANVNRIRPLTPEDGWRGREGTHVWYAKRLLRRCSNNSSSSSQPIVTKKLDRLLAVVNLIARRSR